MPPCPTSPPPALALVSPWQAPGYYVLVLVVMVGFGVVVLTLYALATKPLTRRTRVAFVLLVAGAVGVLVGIGFDFLVLEPFMDHILVWSLPQLPIFDGQPCSRDAQAALTKRLLGTRSAWQVVDGAVVVCCGAIFYIGLFLTAASLPAPHALGRRIRMRR